MYTLYMYFTKYVVPWAKKTCNSILGHNFGKYRPILKILSLWDLQ